MLRGGATPSNHGFGTAGLVSQTLMGGGPGDDAGSDGEDPAAGFAGAG